MTTDGHRDYQTNSAQRVELVKIPKVQIINVESIKQNFYFSQINKSLAFKNKPAVGADLKLLYIFFKFQKISFGTIFLIENNSTNPETNYLYILRNTN